MRHFPGSSCRHCLFLTKGRYIQLSIDINKPWKYGLLQASFDFPIYKGDEEVRREQDSIMTNYHPTSFCRKIQVKKQSASLKVITTGAYAR